MTKNLVVQYSKKKYLGCDINSIIMDTYQLIIEFNSDKRDDDLKRLIKNLCSDSFTEIREIYPIEKTPTGDAKIIRVYINNEGVTLKQLKSFEKKLQNGVSNIKQIKIKSKKY